MAERYIPEHRRTQFKAKGTFKPEELRRRREEQQVEIRRAKREENLAKRRGITGRDGQVTVGGPGAGLGAAPDSDDEGGNIENQVGPSCLIFQSTVHPFHPGHSLGPVARVVPLPHVGSVSMRHQGPCPFRLFPWSIITHLQQSYQDDWLT